MIKPISIAFLSLLEFLQFIIKIKAWRRDLYLYDERDKIRFLRRLFWKNIGSTFQYSKEYQTVILLW